MAGSRYGFRRAKNVAAQILAILATIFGLFWLVWILWTTLHNGLASINLALFTKMTPPPGETGGISGFARRRVGFRKLRHTSRPRG